MSPAAKTKNFSLRVGPLTGSTIGLSIGLSIGSVPQNIVSDAITNAFISSCVLLIQPARKTICVGFRLTIPTYWSCASFIISFARSNEETELTRPIVSGPMSPSTEIFAPGNSLQDFCSISAPLVRPLLTD